MNNKGFAVSGMLYSILVLFLIMIMSILATLGARKLILDKTKSEVYTDIVNESNKEQMAAYQIINKNSGTENFAADNKNTNINANLAYTSKYYFKGANPDNYLTFAGACWRIISISQNNTIKIIYEANTCNPTTTSGRVNSGDTWNTKNINNWYDGSTNIRTYLENAANSGNIGSLTISSSNMNKVDKATWYVGAVYYDTKYTLNENILQERTGKGHTNLPDLVDQGATEYTWENKVGLMNISDYIKASSNSLCYNAYTMMASSNCKTNNYLYKAYNAWTLNANGNNSTQVWVARSHSNATGIWDRALANLDTVSLRPVLYLRNDVKITGDGTKDRPFVVS